MTGEIATAMANAPLPDGPKETANKPKKEGNPILAILGSPQFAVGDGKKYPRQTGWGAQKKAHPDGGTNETVAWVIFKPFKGLDLAQEGRIYCESFVRNGATVRKYSISLPFLKADKRDASGRMAIESLKLHVRDSYRKWLKSDDSKADTNKKPASADSEWEESTEAPDAPK